MASPIVKGTAHIHGINGTVTGLTGTLLGAANGFYSAPQSNAGHFETEAGSALSGSLSGDVNVQGYLTYSLMGG